MATFARHRDLDHLRYVNSAFTEIKNKDTLETCRLLIHPFREDMQELCKEMRAQMTLSEKTLPSQLGLDDARAIVSRIQNKANRAFDELSAATIREVKDRLDIEIGRPLHPNHGQAFRLLLNDCEYLTGDEATKGLNIVCEWAQSLGVLSEGTIPGILALPMDRAKTELTRLIDIAVKDTADSPHSFHTVTGSQTRATEDRATDGDRRPPRLHCTIHGWCGHTDEECRTQQQGYQRPSRRYSPPRGRRGGSYSHRGRDDHSDHEDDTESGSESSERSRSRSRSREREHRRSPSPYPARRTQTAYAVHVSSFPSIIDGGTLCPDAPASARMPPQMFLPSRASAPLHTAPMVRPGSQDPHAAAPRPACQRSRSTPIPAAHAACADPHGALSPPVVTIQEPEATTASSVTSGSDPSGSISPGLSQTALPPAPQRATVPPPVSSGPSTTSDSASHGQDAPLIRATSPVAPSSHPMASSQASAAPSEPPSGPPRLPGGTPPCKSALSVDIPAPRGPTSAPLGPPPGLSQTPSRAVHAPPSDSQGSPCSSSSAGAAPHHATTAVEGVPPPSWTLLSLKCVCPCCQGPRMVSFTTCFKCAATVDSSRPPVHTAGVGPTPPRPLTVLTAWPYRPPPKRLSQHPPDCGGGQKGPHDSDTGDTLLAGPLTPPVLTLDSPSQCESGAPPPAVAQCAALTLHSGAPSPASPFARDLPCRDRDDNSCTLRALYDTGSYATVLSPAAARIMGEPLPLQNPFPVSLADGSPASATEWIPISLSASADSTTIAALIFPLMQDVDMILGCDILHDWRLTREGEQPPLSVHPGTPYLADGPGPAPPSKTSTSPAPDPPQSLLKAVGSHEAARGIPRSGPKERLPPRGQRPSSCPPVPPMAALKSPPPGYEASLVATALQRHPPLLQCDTQPPVGQPAAWLSAPPRMRGTLHLTGMTDKSSPRPLSGRSLCLAGDGELNDPPQDSSSLTASETPRASTSDQCPRPPDRPSRASDSARVRPSNRDGRAVAKFKFPPYRPPGGASPG